MHWLTLNYILQSSICQIWKRKSCMLLNITNVMQTSHFDAIISNFYKYLPLAILLAPCHNSRPSAWTNTQWLKIAWHTTHPPCKALLKFCLYYLTYLLMHNGHVSTAGPVHLNPLIVCVQRNIVATPYGWYRRSCQCKSFYTAEAQWIENKFCMITSSHGLGLLCQISSFQKWREIPGVLHYNIYVNQ